METQSEFIKDKAMFIAPDKGSIMLVKYASELEQELETIKSRLADAEKVIGFYGDFENWQATKNGSYKSEGIFFITRDNPYIQTENGKLAREYMEKNKAN